MTDGILDLLDPVGMDEESSRERRIRDEHAVRDGLTLDWQHSPEHMAEIAPTLSAMGELAGSTILELGCGNGRFTVLLARGGARVVAVDFSREALVRLRARLDPEAEVLLVQADVTRLRVAPRSFDVALSTLVSNLPTREHRRQMYRLAAAGLRPEGRFVFGTHLHGPRERYLRIAKSGTYPDTDIYRYNFTLRECRAEPGEFFGRVTARPIKIYLPLLRRISRPSPHAVSRVLEHVPVLNRFGALTVCVASRPRPPFDRPM